MEHRRGGSCNRSHLRCRSTSVSIWRSGNSMNSETFCVYSGSEFSLGVSTQPDICCNLQEKPWPPAAPALGTIRTPEKGASGCTSPAPPVPCEGTELSKPRCCGTHEASPAMVSHRQIKSTWEDGGTVRSRNTLLQDALSSGNCRRAGCIQLEPAYCSSPGVPGRSSQCSPSVCCCQAESLQPPRSAGARPQTWNPSAWLHTKVWWAAAGHKPGFPSACQPHFDLT